MRSMAEQSGQAISKTRCDFDAISED